MEENGARDARRRSLCTAISLSLTWARGNASRIIDAESERGRIARGNCPLYSSKAGKGEQN